jgi:hypothetical protein
MLFLYERFGFSYARLIINRAQKSPASETLAGLF